MTQQVEYFVRAERNATTFDNTFQTLGVAFPAPGIYFKIVNTSDTLVDVSTNGGDNEHDVVPANNTTVVDVRTNKSLRENSAFQQGTQFHIRGAAAGVGIVYLVALLESP